MPLDDFMQTARPEIEAELQKQVNRVSGPGLDGLRQMLAYHMGWEGEGAGAGASGKRIRPALALLVCAACGSDWRAALPAGAAVELIHNFSLIHDDIEDDSPLRHGRATLWKLWGIAQAINTGDALFTQAHLALLDLEERLPPGEALAAARILQSACLRLTQGQHLDIAFETRRQASEAEYWQMVGGKTAALLEACAELGALVGQATAPQRAAYAGFGRLLGLAFQAQDDLLGIWGDAALTGKSAESDLLAGKKSLPVVFALDRPGAFARRWLAGPITAHEVPGLAGQLEAEGARAYTRQRADELTGQALQALAEAGPQGEAGAALRELALKLLRRKM